MSNLKESFYSFLSCLISELAKVKKSPYLTACLTFCLILIVMKTKHAYTSILKEMFLMKFTLVLFINFSLRTKCYVKKRLDKKHQGHCILTNLVIFFQFFVYELRYLSSKCKELLSRRDLFPNLSLYIFL